MSDRRAGVVSVVILNYLGSGDTLTCVRSLADLDWPAERLEVVVVENASPDDSAVVLRRELPDDVRLVVSPSNGGFTGGCNLGVRESSGEYVAFLNNDARPDPDWVREAVAVFDAEPSVGCVASRVLDWDGKLVDYVDGALTWYGMGYKREAGWPDKPAYDEPKDVLFATGSAMFVRADLFEQVGGFDERFFMFYEDVDLGWRLNVLGHTVRYVPTSVAFHKHHATMRKFGAYREEYLLERNALMAMYKNYGDASLTRLLAPAMALAVRRSLARSDVDTSILDLQRSPGDDATESATVPKAALSGAFAIDYFVDQLPGLAEERSRIQSLRQRPDTDVIPLFRNAIEPAYPVASYLQGHTDLVAAFGVDQWWREQPSSTIDGLHWPATAASPSRSPIDYARRAVAILRAEGPPSLVRKVSFRLRKSR